MNPLNLFEEILLEYYLHHDFTKVKVPMLDICVLFKKQKSKTFVVHICVRLQTLSPHP